MSKITLTLLLPVLLLFGYSSRLASKRLNPKAPAETGTLEKMLVANGAASLDLDVDLMQGTPAGARTRSLQFGLVSNSFFTILVFNKELRGLLPGSVQLVPQNSVTVPEPLQSSYRQLVVESNVGGEAFELVVRDGKSGFVFFNIEGHSFDYQPKERLLRVVEGKLLLSREFAEALGQPNSTGSTVGKILITATMRATEITKVVNGEAVSAVMPSLSDEKGIQPKAGSVPGPDVIVGDLSGLAQFDASSGTQVGLAVATDSCNAGTVDLNWFALPSNDHPVIPQNLYRMSGGATNDERFEQIGQSNVKHAFTALTQNLCSFGCNGVGGTHLGSGCSDPYSASLNSGGTGHTLGSRAWINPFTGSYPRGDSATPPNSHTGHSHTGPSHRILVEMNDLNTTLNPGATYFVEAQYITPHEYAWCLANPTQCNMYNNVSFRKYNVSGTGSPFGFSPNGSTVQSKPALSAWSGANSAPIEPAPGNDGIGVVAYKVTNPSAGVWHYEYAVYNQNLDRGIQSFSVPLAAGVNVSNIGFHAPPQHPGSANDGTVGDAGYSAAPWAQSQAGGALTWSSETFAQNQNANAIRWGTLYNFRFDSDRPPQAANATVGFFKTGAPLLVAVQGPSAPLTGPNIFGRDASGAEPGSGTSSLVFTVWLSAPAGAGGTSVNYATANDSGGNPATGGGACGGSVDYVTKNGTLSFAAGEQLKTVSVNICADSAAPESNETLLLNLSNATNGAILDSQAVGTIGQGGGATAGSVLISELRTSGPGGAGDDFVELYNNSIAPLTVAASDASAGYGVYKLGADCNATPILVGVIPNGTVIPARGHFLLVGSQYGLSSYAAGDLTMTSDIGDDRNVALFSTAEVTNLSTATRLDAVGFGGNNGGGVCDLPRESLTLAAAGGSSSAYSFVRKENTGVPQDTNDNAQDFILVSTNPFVAVGNNPAPLLGAPGPENLASPLSRSATIKASLVDPTASSSSSPNRERDTSPDPPNNSTLGTLDIRRRFKNNTGGPVTRLRFRIVDITSYPVPAGTADLRARTSGLVVVSLTGGGTANVEGTTLESTQPNGGGMNSSLAAGTVSPALPIAPGASINLRFLLGVQQGGTFRFFITVEALP